jgi:hypothetical protein
MLDDINELRTFVSVIAARSLSAAAREMDLALSVVSKRLAALERRAGIRLLQGFADGAMRASKVVQDCTWWRAGFVAVSCHTIR